MSKHKVQHYFKQDNTIEIGIDEAGRGPMFGRVYSAAVILPKDDTFDHSQMKDSKKFSSQKKIIKAAEYIKEHAISWGIGYIDETTIDTINIRQATHRAMHMAIRECLQKISNATTSPVHLLVDGNDFKPYMQLNKEYGFVQIPHTTITGGDNLYSSIAAASILAKVERDKYIVDLCAQTPLLDERYEISKNKGYGTAAHIKGITQFGISKYHRKSFGICKNYADKIDVI